MTFDEALKARIMELCDKNKITLNKLCTQAGVTHSTLASFLSGKTQVPKANTVYYIALGFNMTLSEFYNSPFFIDIDDE